MSSAPALLLLTLLLVSKNSQTFNSLHPIFSSYIPYNAIVLVPSYPILSVVTLQSYRAFFVKFTAYFSEIRLEKFRIIDTADCLVGSTALAATLIVSLAQ